MLFMNLIRMQNKMRKTLFFIIAAILLAACTKETGSGLGSIENPRADKQVSMYGETVSVTFQAEGPWSARSGGT